MSVIVTGATGFIGRHLVARLLGTGTTVRILVRDPRTVPTAWEGKVEIVVGTLLDSEAIGRAVGGRRVLFHLAGEARNPQAMRAINVDGTRALAERALAAGVERIISLSSVGVFGADEPGVVTETTPCRPRNEYERTKWEGEQALARCAEIGPIRVVILRPTIVFGEDPGRRQDSFLEWLRAIDRGRFTYIGRGGVANYVYAGDVVDAMLRVARRDGRGCEAFIVADSVSLEDFVGAAADALGVARPVRRVPRSVGLAAGACLEAIGWLTRRPVPLTRARARALASRTTFSGALLAAGWEGGPPFGYREGLRRTVAAYRSRGELQPPSSGA